jgi:hypothetical protein
MRKLIIGLILAGVMAVVTVGPVFAARTVIVNAVVVLVDLEFVDDVKQGDSSNVVAVYVVPQGTSLGVIIKACQESKKVIDTEGVEFICLPMVTTSNVN